MPRDRFKIDPYNWQIFTFDAQFPDFKFFHDSLVNQDSPCDFSKWQQSACLFQLISASKIDFVSPQC